MRLLKQLDGGGLPTVIKPISSKEEEEEEEEINSPLTSRPLTSVLDWSHDNIIDSITAQFSTLKGF